MKSIKVSRWDLSELVNDPKDIDYKIKNIEKHIEEIERKKGLLKNDITIEEFKSIINLVEEIYEELVKINAYAHLSHAADLRSDEIIALVNRIDRFSADINNRLLFFDLWFKKNLDDENAMRLINGIDSMYKDYFKHKRLVAKYSLNEREEMIMNMLDVTGYIALIKLYDRITDTFEFVVEIKKDKKVIRKVFKNKEGLLRLVRSIDAREREGAYKALLKVYEKNYQVLGDIYNNIAIKWNDEFIKLRGYKTPISVRNIANNISDEVIDTLLHVCKNNAYIFQEYFKAKAKLLDMKRLRRYDIYAPLKSSKKFTYQDGIKLVLEAFGDFDDRFKRYAEMIFKTHVDYEIREGKRSGAFCYSTTPKLLPYVLLNFDGTSRSISTIAHEFGHAMHSILSSDKSILVHSPPLPLAETASVFAEMLLNDRLEKIVSKKDKIALIVEEIDDMYATVMRQAYFTLFEIEAHKSIINNSTIDDISDIYYNNLKDQFGSSILLTKEFRYEWLYIPHFYHTPFYCYAYSFGNLLTLSLYNEYKLDNKGFKEKYFAILNTGGSRKSEDILLEHGFDISKSEFWNNGFSIINEKINELKSLVY